MSMTPREIFDKIKVHLLAQGARSVDVVDDRTANTCMYRSDEGLSCAVGCLFDEGFDTHELEGCGCADQRVLTELWKEGVFSTKPSRADLEDDGKGLICFKDVSTLTGNSLIVSMLMDLQDLHDSWTVEDWNERFDYIELKYIAAL